MRRRRDVTGNRLGVPIQARSPSRCIAAIALLATLPIVRVAAQDSHPDRFGFGVAGIEGWFGGSSVVFPGAEGFVRIARGSFWNVRVDGALYAGRPAVDKVCAGMGNGGCVDDTRYLGELGTLIATLALGPTATNGLRPIYALLGIGGVASRWGGGSCSPPASACPSPVSDASGAGPSLTIIEGGLGSEFHALGGNRIEVRVHRISPPQPTGTGSATGAVGASLTIGIVW
jgi:hypothetical protein